MSEVLRDPLIRQMLRADKVSLGAFAQLLENAANDRGRKLAARGWAAEGQCQLPLKQEYQSAIF